MRLPASYGHATYSGVTIIKIKIRHFQQNQMCNTVILPDVPLTTWRESSKHNLQHSRVHMVHPTPSLHILSWQRGPRILNLHFKLIFKLNFNFKLYQAEGSWYSFLGHSTEYVIQSPRFLGFIWFYSFIFIHSSAVSSPHPPHQSPLKSLMLVATGHWGKREHFPSSSCFHIEGRKLE